MKRIHEAYTIKAELALMNWIVARLPSFVTPDALTLFGLFGSFLCSAGLLASWADRDWLFLALIGLVFQNFGDSLDGNLARYRHIERPRYGFMVDHGCDLLSQVLLALGFGLSPYVRLDCALLALVGYLSVSVVSFQRLHATGQLHLSYNRIGPTEIRIVLFVGILLLYFFGPLPIGVLPIGRLRASFGAPDLVAIAIFLSASFLAYAAIWATAGELRDERPGARTDGSDAELGHILE